MPELDTGDTAWMLVSTALVLFMTPGLAFFYGGMVRSKNVLGMLAQNFVAMGVVTVLWVFGMYALAFGQDHGKFIGWDSADFGLRSAMHVMPANGLPTGVFMMFQLTFAI